MFSHNTVKKDAYNFVLIVDGPRHNKQCSNDV